MAVKNSSTVYMNIGPGLYMMLGLPTITFWTTNDRPKNAVKGIIGFNQQTKSLEYFNGSNWFSAKMNEKSIDT